jgi:hypothetical protein
VRCGRCGNENAEANRFCGMCGAPLAAKDQAGPAASAREAEPRTAPVITGPSFLGLNAPAREDDTRRYGFKEDQAAGRQDPLRPSSNVDYLLEDDEEPRRGWGKWILVVVALGLAVGFGYLRWKRGGFDWLNADRKPTAATVQAPDTGSGADSGAAAPTAAPASGAVPPQAGSGTAPAGGAANAAESAAPQTTAPPGSSQGTPSADTAAPNAASQGTPAQTPAAQTTAAQGAEPQSASPSNAGDSGAAAGSRAAESDSDKQPPAAEVTPKAMARKPAAAKPAVTKPAAAKPVDSVTEAERYIYGRGAEQDCDRGLRLLKPAAEQSNVKAMVSLGVLYSTGTCTPRDLPTAYRWFALALHKEPDNQALQDDLQSLWAKMTPPERQLAIKLSQ